MNFNKKKFATLCLTGAMALSLAACKPTEPEVANSPEPAPVVSETPETVETPEVSEPVEATPEVSEIPEEVETTPVDEETTGDKVVPMTELSVTLFEDEGVEFTTAESWRNNYYVEFNETDEHPRDKVTYYTYGEDGKGRYDLVSFELVKDESKLPEESATVTVFNGDGFFVVETTYPDDDNAMIKEMLTDLDTDSYLYIPEPIVIPEGAVDMVNAIKSARSEEENTYMEIFADPENFPINDLIQVEEGDIENFAMSVSMMNVKAYSIIVVKPAEGKANTIKDALTNYADGIRQSFEGYLPDQLEIAKNAQIEKFGDYVALVICENAEDVMSGIKTALS